MKKKEYHLCDDSNTEEPLGDIKRLVNIFTSDNVIVPVLLKMLIIFWNSCDIFSDKVIKKHGLPMENYLACIFQILFSLKFIFLNDKNLLSFLKCGTSLQTMWLYLEQQVDMSVLRLSSTPQGHGLWLIHSLSWGPGVMLL